jgi:hypothetical protein
MVLDAQFIVLTEGQEIGAAEETVKMFVPVMSNCLLASAAY